MSTRKALQFLRRVLIVALVLFIITGSMVIVQLMFQPFDPLIAKATEIIAEANGVANTNLITGISIGMLLLAVVASVLPLLSRKINRRQYLVAAQRGVVAALVFFFSQMLYDWAENLSRFWLIVSIVGVVVLTFVVIETLALLMRKDEEVAFRTDIIASIASGLVAGIVIKLIMVIAHVQA
jgi:hypothetical protein